MPDARSILDPLQFDRSLKAAAWDAFTEAQDESDFQRRMDAIDLPRNVKADLWDAKFAKPSPQPSILPFLPPMPKAPNAILRGDVSGEAARAQNSVMMGDYGAEFAQPLFEAKRLGDAAASIATGAKRVTSGKSIDDRLGGASQAIRAAGEAAAPYILPAFGPAIAAAPLATAANVAAGAGLQYGVERGAKALGIGEGASQLAGDVAGAVPLANIGRTAAKALKRTPAPVVEAPAPITAQPKQPSVAPVRPPPRDVRRAALIPDDAAPPEEVLRVQDRRQILAKGVFEKPWEDLTNPERLLIDEQLTAPPAGRELREMPTPFASKRRREKQRGSLPLPTKAELQAKALKLRTEMTDRLAPIEDVEKLAPSVPFAERAYPAARSFGGVRGIVANRLSNLGNIVRPAAKAGILEDAKKIMALERHEELFSRIPNYVAPDGLDLPTAQAQRAALESSLSPDKLAKVKQVSADLRKYSDGIMQYARDKGVLSQEALDKIRADNQFYTPFQRIEMIESELGKGLPVGRDSFSVAANTAMGRIEGSELAIADPLESMVRNTNRIIHLAERNNIARKLAAHANRPEFKGVVMELKSGQRPGAGFEKLSYLDDGVPKEYAVPEGVAQAMRGLSQDHADIVTRSMAWWARMLRTGVTLEPTFMMRNTLRDATTASVASRLPGVGFTPADWAYGFVSAVTKGIPDRVVPAPLKRFGVGDSAYNAFLDSKGAFGGFYHGQSPQATAADLVAGPLGKVKNRITSVRGLADALDVIATPMQKVGETLELAPRIGVFRKAKMLGMSNDEAGWKARNATVDFERRGASMKAISMAVPFLNANIQGRLNMVNAIKEAPLATSMRLAAVAGVPALLAYAVGKTYFQEEYDSISDFEKDQNMIFVYGKGRDAEGNLAEAIAIPRGDAGPFTVAAEKMLEAYRQKEPLKWKRLMLQTVSDLSPVPIAREGKLSLGGGLSTLLPTPFKAAGETWSNTNFFTGRKIVPDYIHGVPSQDISPKNQYMSRTAPLMVKAADALDKVGIEVSPMKLANAAGTLGGYMGRRLANPEVSGKVFVRGITGARTDATNKPLMEAIQAESQSFADRKVEISRSAESLLDQVVKLPPDQRAAFARERINAEAERIYGLASKGDGENKEARVNELRAEFGEEFIDAAEKMAKGVIREERAMLRLGVEPRARVAVKALREMTPEKRNATVKRWSEVKILTPKVIDAMSAMLEEGK